MPLLIRLYRDDIQGRAQGRLPLQKARNHSFAGRDLIVTIAAFLRPFRVIYA